MLLLGTLGYFSKKSYIIGNYVLTMTIFFILFNFIKKDQNKGQILVF